MSAEARFAPGDWYAVVGDHVTVLLPGSQRGRVAELWDLADTGATADAVLDALLAGGLSSLDHFALVAHSDDSTRLLVRGAPTASVSTTAGDEIVSAAPGTAWSEQVLTGVSSIRVTLTGDSAVEHVLTPGLSRVSVVEFGTPSGAGAAPAAEVPEAPAPPAEPEEPVLAVVPEPTPDAEPTPDPEPEPTPEPDPTPEPEPVPVEVPASAAPLTFGEPEDDPTPTGETPVVEDDWTDRDGQTMAGPPQVDFDRPPVPGQEIAPDVVSQPVASLVFSTGDVISVDRTILVGRAPEARRFASHDQPHVVTVSSPHQEISSTHLEIRPGAGADHGSAIATDLGSTNGTVLAQPGLDPEELTPGIAVSLIPGAVLDLGDGVTIQVTNP
ncbi:hypothetical protein SAMN05192575_104142 [Nocardioides alpinus]|uniref:FHA domain-containing protein n=1 Tax=Nocardioides alpinus TaxID=748909 RepID=A0A1I0YRH7_9ACTN|nr:FHA domain-containing protein [Nocardioides alpinus]PKH43670.1 FHA domain-containing protein [Nocardioides alpinus]SFB15406.1 hypothetical protein SAMN05192575_104142 [Nocardioides alpinus]